jgi:2'-5' RNA ligase
MKLFFIALLPDITIQDEVTAFKQLAQQRFESGHALKSPPHVTLIPPFKSNETDFSALQDFTNNQPQFVVELKNFDRFGSRVIFVDVVENQLLWDCQNRLAAFCAHRFDILPDPRPFHPHMTVAFKDLKKTVFPTA